MNPEQIDIKLSARTNAQAVNLGFVTARRYALPLLMASAVATLPVLLLAVMLVVVFDAYFWASLLLWWCKPYYDRVILFNASRLVFRESIGFFDIVDSLGKAARNGLWLNLTFFRFSFTRSLNIPIQLLEGLSGREYSQRVKVIGKGSSSSASGLTIGLLHFDIVLYINCFLLIIMLLPDNVKREFSEWFFSWRLGYTDEEQLWLGLLMLFFQALSSIIVEIFYVMAGFMLYLNSRIKTEGWDIELAFKRMALRLGEVKSLLMSWLAVAFISSLLLLSTAMPTSVKAADHTENTAPNTASTTTKLTPDDDKAVLKDILLDDDINPYEIKTTWEANHLPKEKTNNDSSNFDVDGAKDGLEGFATLLKFALIFIGLFILYLIIINREKFLGFMQGKATVDPDARPTVMFGLAVTKDSLPADIAGEARLLLRRGEILQALSLLYRGSLAVLINDHHVVIKESYTEGDCLNASQSSLGKDGHHYFKQLTTTWQSLVYAHKEPPTANVETLIEQWRHAFAIHRVSAADVGNANGGQHE